MELTPHQQRIVDYVRDHPGQMLVVTLGALSMNQKAFWDDVSRLTERGVLVKKTMDRSKHEGLWLA